MGRFPPAKWIVDAGTGLEVPKCDALVGRDCTLRLPGKQSQAASGFEDPGGFSAGPNRFGREDQSEARDQGVEALVGKWQGRGLCGQESSCLAVPGLPLCDDNHPSCEINSDYRGGTEVLGYERGGSRAARNVQYSVARVD